MVQKISENMVEVSLSDQKKKDKEEPADFETAISATDYGIFNYVLLVILMPSCLSSVYQTSTMSYIFATAECDLKLQLVDKGILNAITYAGMITSAILWGYLADTMGRRKLLIIGYLLDALCVLLSSLSPNRLYLMIFKYLGGFAVCGPFAVLMSYVNEFHGTKHRSRVMMCIGCFFSIATLSLPIIAYVILPNNWNVTIFGLIVIRSWKVFLAVCSLPSLIAGICYIFLPESPKFLMTTGRNNDALKVFQMIYHLNTRNPREQYPIKELVKEIPQKGSNVENNLSDENRPSSKQGKGLVASLQSGLLQLKPMFSKPYLGQSLLVYTIQFFTLMGLNTFRLWVPQLFAIITNYENTVLSKGGEAATLCTMISYNLNVTSHNVQAVESNECIADVDSKTYLNSAVVGVTQLLSYFLAGTVINALGNKTILVMVVTLAGTMGISLYWATNSLTTMIMSAIYVAVGSIGSTAIVGVVATLFPTTLRTMIVSLVMMFGRTGALIGNTLFPIFLEWGCLPPFIMIGGAMFLSAILGLLLPANINKKPLV
ncbi:unnamed protein product [Hermetia illucens]|uniref:Major facilitator superfamily (MFS) profile domain-containing protein n=1 Tax=Hermetia illucens TaxID=343691 RepID=A0A7R8Z396_HERIL|nr:synaptic vesicle glycoprotein 2C-like [Hermetia illucens]CAD7093693.1 unnamed protein product [Hermetia illucens]